mgnify:CR=1 FL=1
MKHHVATLSALPLLIFGGSALISTGVQADGSNLRSIIQTIERDTNKLPIEKVEITGYSLDDLVQLLQSRQKAIAKKIAKVNNHPQPEASTATTAGSSAVVTEQQSTETKSDNVDTKENNTETKVDVKETETVSEEPTPSYDGIQFGSDGLLIETASSLAQSVINDLLSIPGHSNGAGYHVNGIDAKIEQLSTAEAIHVIHRIEGAGFGQTGDGYAGIDTTESHRNFVNKQINNRFGGSVHQLLRKWGTYSYGGY